VAAASTQRQLADVVMLRRKQRIEHHWFSTLNQVMAKITHHPIPMKK
jgi:hypothetical protein